MNPLERRVPRIFAPVTVGLLALGAPAGAWGQGWTVDLNAGRASFETLPTTSTTNAALGLRYVLDRRFFQASLAAPLGSDELFWGAVAAGDRPSLRRGRFEAGVDLAAVAHGQRDPSVDVRGWGIQGQALPVVSASSGPVVAELRSGGSWYRAETDGQAWTRNVWESDLRLTTVPTPDLRVSAEARHLRASEGAYTFVGASASARVDRAHVWASVGEWVSGIELDVPSTNWGGGVSLSVRPSTSVWASVRREAFDPRFLSISRTSWSVGASYRLGSARSRAPSIGPEIRPGGRVVLRLPLSEASSPPYVAGDFSGWEGIPMHRHGSDWRAELRLEPGLYYYAFRTGDGEWFVPEAMPGRRDDGMGGWVAPLIVPEEEP